MFLWAARIHWYKEISVYFFPIPLKRYMCLATKHMASYMEISTGNFHVTCHMFRCKVHRNFHVPCHMFRCKIHRNFHVPCHIFRCKVHGNFHIPCHMLRCKVHRNFHVPCHIFRCKIHGNFRVPCHMFHRKVHGNFHVVKCDIVRYITLVTKQSEAVTHVSVNTQRFSGIRQICNLRNGTSDPLTESLCSNTISYILSQSLKSSFRIGIYIFCTSTVSFFVKVIAW